MRKTKEQKGITLIALIITIIVLLILAVVAIGAVQNDGIIDHAKNAKQEYGAAQVKENTTLQGYLDKIKEYVGTGSGSATGTGNGRTITFTCAGAMYKAAAGMTWGQWMESTNYDKGRITLVTVGANQTFGWSNGKGGYILISNGERTVRYDDPIIEGKDYGVIA